MVKSKSMEVMKAVQEDLGEVKIIIMSSMCMKWIVCSKLLM